MAEREISIAANNQIVGLFTDLFPDTPVSVTRGGAILEIGFDQDVFITAINMKSSRVGEEMDEPNVGSLR